MKTMEVIYSQAVNHPCFPEKWQVSASDILQHLQKTNGRITGPGESRTPSFLLFLSDLFCVF
jgi:hypothetical protein